MLKSFFIQIYQSRKSRFVLFIIWISLIFILFYQCFFGIQYYNLKRMSLPPSFTEETLTEMEKLIILQIIKARNEDQLVRNLDLYGPITNDTIIILIQTHKRKMYLQALIDSLKDTRYINETLLIFSHGSYDKDMNQIVRAVDFTRVLQIFFPYSHETYPNSFPGFPPDEYPHDNPESKFPTNCFRKDWNFKQSQVKHHWWWKINFVFNHLRIAQDFGGLVLFLEEDHYVFPDVLHMLKLMKVTSITQCSDCNVFGLGQNPKKVELFHYRKFSHQASVQQWNNMGFAFTRAFWRGLDHPNCKNMFCEYNDLNWDFTLAYLSHKCLPQEIKPLTVITPRVFHIGDCGMHFSHHLCSASLDKARDLEKTVVEFLFPPLVTVLSTYFLQRKIDEHNGEWSDPCDIGLCKQISQNQT